MEAQEIADEAEGVTMKGQSKASKGGPKRKQKLMTKEETKPSPYGRRVQPRIDPALLKKTGGAGAGRGRKKVRNLGKNCTLIKLLILL